MRTPHKITPQELHDNFQNYFLRECYQGPNSHWRHKCGTIIRMIRVSLSIHNNPIALRPGGPFLECSGAGRVETRDIPFCNRCEPPPAPDGCLHELADAPIQIAIDSTKAPPILIWRFEEAPESLQKLSPHSGDEDWLALIPPTFQKTGAPDWMDTGTRFAPCHYSETILSGGFVLAIGTHS